MAKAIKKIATRKTPAKKAVPEKLGTTPTPDPVTVIPSGPEMENVQVALPEVDNRITNVDGNNDASLIPTD